MPSLRATIGAMTAFIVLAVAATTLSVTLTYSIDALRTIGKTHAEAMLQIASSKTRRLLAIPDEVGSAMQALHRSDYFPIPDAVPDRAPLIGNAMQSYGLVQAMRPELTDILSMYADGSRNIAELEPASARTRVQVITVRSNASLVEDHREYYDVNNSAVPAARRTFLPPPQDGRVLFGPTGPFTQLFRVMAGPFASSTFFYSVDASLVKKADARGNFVVGYALRGLKVARNDSGTDLGVTIASTDLSAIDAFLRSAKAGGGVEAFLADADGYLLGATHVTPWRTITTVPAGTRPGAGCGTTESTSGPVPPVFMGCRDHVSRHAYAPLRHVANNTNMLAAGGRARVDFMRIDGNNFFVAREAITPANSMGVSTVLVLFLPEEDVLGDVTTGRNIAIGISVAVFVVATAIAIVAVSVLLSPLTEVSDRMYAAASLQDDGDEMPASAMSEIAALQQSYAALNSQLKKLKSFVPQSVLGALLGDGDEDELATVATHVSERDEPERARSNTRLDAASSGQSSTHEEAASVRSSRRTATGSKVGSSFTAVAGAALNFKVGVQERSISVVMLNLRGFTRAAEASSHQLPTRYANFIDIVQQAAVDHGGVLDYFNGDRAMITFNAARPAVSHSRKAALAALHIASAPFALQLPVLAGIASGRALVGNLGCEAAKRHCSIGPVVARAAALMRLAGAYEPLTTSSDAATQKCAHAAAATQVLISGRLLEELQATFRIRVVDFVQLPGHESAVVAEVLSQVDAGATTAEWLYVVGDGEGATGQKNPDAGAGDVFQRLQRGDIAGARSSLDAALARCQGEPPAVLGRAQDVLKSTPPDAAQGSVVGRVPPVMW